MSQIVTLSTRKPMAYPHKTVTERKSMRVYLCHHHFHLHIAIKLKENKVSSRMPPSFHHARSIGTTM